MSCETMMIRDVVTVKMEDTVKYGLELMLQHRIRMVPVVDDQYVYFGDFNFHQILNKMLPPSAVIKGGLDHIDFLGEDFEGMFEKMDAINEMKVKDVYDSKAPFIDRKTNFWEAMLILHRNWRPLSVVDKKTGKLVGLITEQSAVNYFADKGILSQP